MCLAGGTGADLDLPPDVESLTGWLFGEEQGRYVVAVRAPHAAGLLARAQKAGVIAREIGTSGGDALTLSGEMPICLADMRTRFEGWLPALMAGDAGDRAGT
jgi:phosphoribosylformylglycinamidine synthase